MDRLRTPHVDAANWRHALFAVLLAAAPCLAEPVATPPPAPRATLNTDSERAAAAILERMTHYVSGLQAFSVKFRDGYDVVQASGQKIEFGEQRSVVIERPNRLRVDEISSDGGHDFALFDGKSVTVYDSDAQVYAQAPQPGSVDDTLVYFVRDLKMRMPLALLLTTRLPHDLPGRITAIDYVESTDLWGVPADHIAGRTANVDFQFWIRKGAEPLPLRVVITYREEPGQPQFWATLTDWKTAPDLRGSTFDLALPKEARRIDFAVQARALPQTPRAEVLP